MARFSTEAEYRALIDTTFELLWLRWIIKDLGVSTSSTTPLYCDNQNAIHIAHNDVFHEWTKHRDRLSFYPLSSCPWCSQADLSLF